MTTRLPPSSKPPGSSGANQAQQARRSRGTRPQASEKPTPIKTAGAQKDEEALNSPEAALWGGQDYDKSLEVRASEIEAKMGEQAASQAADAEEGADHAADVREANEHAEKDKPGLFKLFSFQKGGQGTGKDPKQSALAAKLAQQEALKKQEALKGGQKPAFGGATSTSASKLQPVTTASPTSVSASRLQAVGGVQNRLMGSIANAERPPDAFALLKDAREKGLLFVEDALAEGHSEDQEDPEHAAAVEECIRLCFGVRGILRIGPGHNDKNEPIIVVATTHGFSDASLARVPEKVHRFATLIAIPFDLLPLRRER